MSQQTNLQRVIHLMETKGLSADDANIELIRNNGVRLINGKIPMQTRRALNSAVKDNRLGHLKRDGLMPEAYFHPNSRAIAREMRRKEAIEGIEAIAKVCV